MEEIVSVIQWSSNLIDKSSSLSVALDSLSIVASIAWFSWIERNEFLFHGSPRKSVHHAVRCLEEFAADAMEAG